MPLDAEGTAGHGMGFSGEVDGNLFETHVRMSWQQLKMSLPSSKAENGVTEAKDYL